MQMPRSTPANGYRFFMSNVDDAAALKAEAEKVGLRVRDRISHPTASRFVITLDHGTDADHLYVHASPNKISITVDLTDGATDSLTLEEALRRVREGTTE